MKKLSALAALSILCAEAIAGNPLKVSGTANFESAYLWRGEKVCEVNFNPILEASIGGFTAQAFAYLPFDGSYKEIDIDFSYAIGPVSLHIADYFCRFANSTTQENYFDFRKATTNHLIEGIICYAPKSLPIAANWFTFFYGDWRPDASGGRGEPAFSSYLELKAHHDFSRWGRGEFIFGSSVLKGPYTSYTKDFAVIHCELRYSKTLELEHIRFPLSVSFLVNPYARRAFMNASVGVSF